MNKKWKNLSIISLRTKGELGQKWIMRILNIYKVRDMERQCVKAIPFQVPQPRTSPSPSPVNSSRANHHPATSE